VKVEVGVVFRPALLVLVLEGLVARHARGSDASTSGRDGKPAADPRGPIHLPTGVKKRAVDAGVAGSRGSSFSLEYSPGSGINHPMEGIMRIAIFVACCVLVACNDRTVERPDPGPPVDEIDLEGLEVSPDDDDVVFQYVDPASGKPVAVTDIEKIPEAQRETVMVLYSGERRDRLTARALALADLTAPGEDGRYPVRLVNRWDFEPSGLKAPAGAGAQVLSTGDGVVLYTAPGCGHCDRARKWFTEKGIPFTEKDVHADPAAVGEISALGRAQGVPESYLSSVPLINVKGKLLVGFDPRQVEAALGTP
jgi:glutaredoxin